jgi:hypothetical protein
MNRTLTAAVMLVAAVSLVGCGEQSRTYTLYRNSPVIKSLRIHFSTFNADESGSYNEENCNVAADLMNKEASRIMNGEPAVRYWCELGKFKK